MLNVTLIGMAGVGKTTIGKEIAKRLDYEFIDIDNLMEENTGKKIKDIIDEDGDDEFMRLEEETVLELGEIEKHVISPGGSIIYCNRAMEYLKDTSFVIFLSDSYENIIKRMSNAPTRGIIGMNENTGLRDVFEERLPLYGKYSHITVNMEGCQKEEIIDDIMRIFGR